MSLSSPSVHHFKAILENPAISKSYKTFLIAYVYFVLPRVIGQCVQAYKKQDLQAAVTEIRRTLIRTLQRDKLPSFLFKLIFSYHVLKYFTVGKRQSRLLPAILASLFAYTDYKHAVIKHSKADPKITNSRLDNISAEITGTVAARALDTLLRQLLNHPSVARRLPRKVRNAGDIGLFTASCFVIMFSWFYYPERLQKRYRNWITNIAMMDYELLTALRLIRNKKLIYGHPNEHDQILKDMCVRYAIDPDQGNTTKTVPIPCLLVHGNACTNCELHALWRFYRGFKAAMLIYVPLNLLLVLRRPNRGNNSRLHYLRNSLKQVLKGSSKSAAFLGTFIALNWYSVCLVRSRLGPLVFPKATAQQLEDTWGPGLGSFMCGLSIIIEETRRRSELALFVFSKAFDIFLPPSFGSRHFTLDTLLFTAGMTVLITRQEKAKGYFGNLLRSLF